MINSQNVDDIPLRPFTGERTSDIVLDGAGGCATSNSSQEIIYPPYHVKPNVSGRPLTTPFSPHQNSRFSDQTLVTYAMGAPVPASRPGNHDSTWAHRQMGGPPDYQHRNPRQAFTQPRNMNSSTDVYNISDTRGFEQRLPYPGGPPPHGQVVSEQHVSRQFGSRHVPMSSYANKEVVMIERADRPTDIIEVRRREQPVLHVDFVEVGKEMMMKIKEKREKLKKKVILTLTAEKIDLGRDLLNFDTDQFYELLDFKTLLSVNKSKDRLPRLINALAILEKYCVNLVKQPRPPLWRTIKLTNSVFVSQVKCIRGWKPVLNLMGYTEEMPNALAFPSKVKEPDVERVTTLAVDLFIAHSVVDALVYEQHPYLIVDPPVQRPPSARSSTIPKILSEFQDKNGSYGNLSSKTAEECIVCGCPPAVMKCDTCDGTRCMSCDETWHSHSKRKDHRRVNILSTTGQPLIVPPPPALMNQAVNNVSVLEPNTVKPPIPAPRRKKPVVPNASSAPGVTICSVKATDNEQQAPVTPRPRHLQRPYHESTVDPSDNENTSHPPRAPSPPEQLKQFWGIPGDNSTSNISSLASSVYPTTQQNIPSMHSTTSDMIYPPQNIPSMQNSASRMMYQPQNGRNMDFTSPPMMYPPTTAYLPPSRYPANLPYPPRTDYQIVPAGQRPSEAELSQPMFSKSQGIGNQFRSIDMYPSVIPTLQNQNEPRRDEVPVSTVTEPPKDQNVLPLKAVQMSCCPNCQMLHPSGVIICKVCKTPLPEKSGTDTHIKEQTQGIQFNWSHYNDGQTQRHAGSEGLQHRSTSSTEATVRNECGNEGWNCEFCTFLNGPDTRICEVCSKSRRQNVEPLKPNKNIPDAKKPIVSQPIVSQPLTRGAIHNYADVPKATPGLPGHILPGLPGNGANIDPTYKAPTGSIVRPQEPGSFSNAGAVSGPVDRLHISSPIGSTPYASGPINGTYAGSSNSKTGSTTGPSQAPGSCSNAEVVGEPAIDASEGMSELRRSCIIESQQQEEALLKEKLEAKRRMKENDELELESQMRQLPEVSAVKLPENLQFPETFPFIQPPLSQGLPLDKMPPKQPSPLEQAYLSPLAFPRETVHSNPNTIPYMDAPPSRSTSFDHSDAYVGYDNEQNMDERKRYELYVDGMQYVMLLREAEKNGFEAEELNVATYLGCEDPEGPINWLKTEWSNKIVSVIGLITSERHDVGNVTTDEAREALIDCSGDVQRAVKTCINNRESKIAKIMENGVYSRTDCNSALDRNYGDVDVSLEQLEKLAIEPILKKIMNNPITEDDEEEETERREHSENIHEIEDVLANKEIGVDKRIRMILAELGTIQYWGRAETAVKLIDMGYRVRDSIEAAKNCGDLTRSLRYLENECPICAEIKPMGEMFTFLNCQHAACKDCISTYITITIQDKSLMHLNCPTCGEPKLDDDTLAMEYFNNLDIMMRGLVDDQTHNLFQQKLRDRTLMKEPNFRWCSHCSSGFINEQPDRLKMTCPHCNKHTCFKCKKQWEDQHEGISCENFAAWKDANDPELQAVGLAAHLRNNGIECPNCQFRYDLAKGGCMHFKCTQCSHEFCSGCYCPFKHGERCGVSRNCANKGLHAHHPRDCLFYLRDRKVEELQKILTDNDVQFDTQPPQNAANLGGNAVAEEGEEDEENELQGAVGGEPVVFGYCKVREQKETGDGLVDAECGDQSPPGYAGLCKLHYVEYLVNIVNDHFIDPADIMLLNELSAVLMRGNSQIPDREDGEDEVVYRERLLAAVKQRLPLPALPPRKRILNLENMEQVQDEGE